MSTLSQQLYNTFIRSNRAMLATVFISAFGIQVAFDSGSEKIWNSINKGRRWADIKQRYMEQPEEEE